MKPSILIQPRLRDDWQHDIWATAEHFRWSRVTAGSMPWKLAQDIGITSSDRVGTARMSVFQAAAGDRWLILGRKYSHPRGRPQCDMGQRRGCPRGPQSLCLHHVSGCCACCRQWHCLQHSAKGDFSEAAASGALSIRRAHCHCQKFDKTNVFVKEFKLLFQYLSCWWAGGGQKKKKTQKMKLQMRVSKSQKEQILWSSD